MGRYLTEDGKRAALHLVTVVVVLAALTYPLWPTSSDASTPRIRYVKCAPGGVHAWLSSEGDIAVMPAGTECP